MDHLQILDSLLKKDYDRRATPTNHLSKSKQTVDFFLHYSTDFCFYCLKYATEKVSFTFAVQD